MLQPSERYFTFCLTAFCTLIGVPDLGVLSLPISLSDTGVLSFPWDDRRSDPGRFIAYQSAYRRSGPRRFIPYPSAYRRSGPGRLIPYLSAFRRPGPRCFIAYLWAYQRFGPWRPHGRAGSPAREWSLFSFWFCLIYCLTVVFTCFVQLCGLWGEEGGRSTASAKIETPAHHNCYISAGKIKLTVDKKIVHFFNSYTYTETWNLSFYIFNREKLKWPNFYSKKSQYHRAQREGELGWGTPNRLSQYTSLGGGRQHTHTV